MQFRYEIPEGFWSLFRSKNRDIYIGALLRINEEYEYHSYFLTKEVCISVLSEHFAKERITVLLQEENETEVDLLEPLAARTLNWLLKAQWLKKLEDYYQQATNIIIPDYTAVFLEAFDKLANDTAEDTQVYIQNIYAILFSFKNDPRANASLLKTALVNTRKLNKSLQDMLHNMDKFFASLLEKQFYGDLLKEHLEGYVQEIIKKKYHILKTSDNFYLYKTDIKKWIRELQQDLTWVEQMKRRSGEELEEERMLQMLEEIDHGFHDIERRLTNMDKEHMKYVRATVTRLNYLLNGESDMKGLAIQLLNAVAKAENPKERVRMIGEKMNLSSFEVLSEKSLYKKRKPKQQFVRELKPDEEPRELTKDEVLRLNRVQNRFSREEIEDFLEKRSRDGVVQMSSSPVTNEEEFEKLILAYDYAIKRGSLYKVEQEPDGMIEDEQYRYPDLTFIRKKITDQP